MDVTVLPLPNLDELRRFAGRNLFMRDPPRPGPAQPPQTGVPRAGPPAVAEPRRVTAVRARNALHARPPRPGPVATATRGDPSGRPALWAVLPSRRAAAVAGLRSMGRRRPSHPLLRLDWRAVCRRAAQ